MKKIRISERSKVLIYQYSGIILLSASGFFWDISKIATMLMIAYGVYITANGYKKFGEFMKTKWNNQTTS